MDVKITLQGTRHKPGQGHAFDALNSSQLFSSLSDDQIDRVGQHANIINKRGAAPVYAG